MATREEQRADVFRLIGMWRRILLAVLVLGALVGKALVTYTAFEGPSDGWVLALLVTIGALTFYDSVLGAVRNYRQPGKERRSTDLQKAMFGALAEIHEITGAPFQDLGGSVWTIKTPCRWLPKFCRPTGWAWLRPRLQRASRLRTADFPQPSDVRWTKGKGTIGRCWATEKKAYDDLRLLAHKYENQDITREGFSQLSSSRTFGLTLKDFNRVIHKYGEVLALPMVDEDGRIHGVISIDITLGDEKDHHTGPVLGGKDVERVVAKTAVLAQTALNSR